MRRAVDIPVDGLWTRARSQLLHLGAPLRSRQALAAARAAIDLEAQFRDVDDAFLKARGQALSASLRLKGYQRVDVVEALALVREVCRRKIGLFPYQEQIAGGYALLRNAAIEMDTGEGKTLTAVCSKRGPWSRGPRGARRHLE